MKYEAYDIGEIQESLDMYLTFDDGIVPLQFERAKISKESPEYNVNTYIKLYEKETTKKISHKEFVKGLTEIKNSGLLDSISIQVIDKLIGDRKLFNKITLCTDGSYLQNKIWGHIKDGKYIIEPDIGYNLWKQLGCRHPVTTDNPKKYIDWIYNNFDTIFLQVAMSTNELQFEFYLKSNLIYDVCDYK